LNTDVDDILAIICEANLLDDPSALQRSLSLAEQGVDSLAHFHIFLMIEERYGVKIADEDIPMLATLDDIVCFVRARQTL
jgi:acyl carrier protein